MSEPTPAPDVEQAPGWYVTDPDGNVVASGGVSIAQADGQLAQLLDQLSTEGEQP